MKRYMKLQAAPFALIAAGAKTVELRLIFADAAA